MVLALVIGAVCLVGVVGTVIASVRDALPPMPTIWGYDTRRPLL